MSTQINDGGPAFPQNVPAGVIGEGCGPHIEWGIAVRDWFAGKALQGMLADATLRIDGNEANIASMSYNLTDAMLAARNQSTK